MTESENSERLTDGGESYSDRRKLGTKREREREEKPQLECNEKVFQNIYC